MRCSIVVCLGAHRLVGEQLGVIEQAGGHGGAVAKQVVVGPAGAVAGAAAVAEEVAVEVEVAFANRPLLALCMRWREQGGEQ